MAGAASPPYGASAAAWLAGWLAAGWLAGGDRPAPRPVRLAGMAWLAAGGLHPLPHPLQFSLAMKRAPLSSVPAMTTPAAIESPAITALRADLAHACDLQERAQHRAQVYTFDFYWERGRACYYPAGKAALTRLAKRNAQVARLKRRLAEALAAEALAASAALEAAEAAARAEFEAVREAVGNVGRVHGFGSPEHRAALPRFAVAHDALVAACAALRTA